MNDRVRKMVSRQYDLDCGRRGFFALESDAKKAVKRELEAQRDELRRRLDEAHAAVIGLSRDLAVTEMDVKELA